ncbi:hypothetical protein H257_01969 [Aphanomyces astaci]|uniref:J domain-containing protein n=1 Tax=Aphanomyces astaci TaxID=112090 RepID=W4H5S7_APHAT|nr:hypothetical protein H257_01969 [Aphanomyces astaci]ETV86946.1 hypothetical protein H257_01969 [Aphanomyces astaci]|eukprot:XP_009823745.1 hypothetical protein H257_01969 [Aphanomyces astaci]
MPGKGGEGVRGVKWSKARQEFTPWTKDEPPSDAETHESAALPVIHPMLMKNYIGTVNVTTLTTRQVEQYFSRDVFLEDCIAIKSNESTDFYPQLCAGITWNTTDIAALAANRPAVELFLDCYHVFLGLLAHTHSALAAQEYIRAGDMFLFLGKFSTARACGQAHLKLGSPASDESAKRIVLQARQCETVLQASMKRMQAVLHAPPSVVSSLMADLDQVRRLAPLSREILHVQTGVLVASCSYESLIDMLTLLPPPLLLDVSVCLALARAFDYTGHTIQAMDALRKMCKQSPVVAKELQRLQHMLDKRNVATKLADGGHFAQAVDAYNVCLTLDANHHRYNANVLYDRAGAFLASGKEKEAIRDLEQCLGLLPTHTLAPARLRAARIQADTSRVRNQIYREQRAHDKHIKKSSQSSVFFKVGSCPNLAARDQVKVMQQDRVIQNGVQSNQQFHRLPQFNLPHVAPLVDLYTILGVHATATIDQIRKAYHRLALQMHPDKSQHVDAADQFKGIAIAYSILSDETSRAQYDAVFNSSIYACQ